MKPIILIFFSLITSIAYGQISYNSADFYNIGDETIFQIASLDNHSFDYAINGENMDWDYSDLSSGSRDTVRILDPNETGYKTSYCFVNFFLFNCDSKFDELTNIAVLGADSLNIGDLETKNLIRHYRKSENSYAETMLGITVNVGELAVPVAFDLEEPDVILQFPLLYTNIDTSESRLVIDLQDTGLMARLARSRTRVNEVEGYGTLRLPGETYQEVLKVKTYIYNLDTTTYDSISIPIRSTEIEYKWFAPEIAGPVLQARGLLLGNSEIITEVRFQGEAVSSNLVDLTPKQSFIVYPNPFNREINIEGVERSVTKIELFDQLGNRVYHREGENKRLKLPQILSPGFYYLLVYDKEGNKDLVKLFRQ